MAVLGVAKIDSLSWEGSGNFIASISYVGTATSASGSDTISGIPANITTALLQTVIANRTKVLLAANFSYTFGLLDYVVVL